MKLWLCAAAAATANYAEHSAERLQTQRDKCLWTTAIKHTGGGDEIAYERAPTGLADIVSPMLTDTQFVQVAGRVVRQGSHHASVRVIVLAAAQSAEAEDAARVGRFRRLSQPGVRD